MARKLNFRSRKGYEKWLSYGHIHGVFAQAKGNSEILIRGRKHKVKHKRKRK